MKRLCIHGAAVVYMWEAEPRLYWRVKIDNKWTWRPATVTGWTPGQVYYTVLPILPQDVE